MRTPHFLMATFAVTAFAACSDLADNGNDTTAEGEGEVGEGEGEPGEGEGESGEGEGEGEGEPPASACAVLSLRCASCHDGGEPPDLRPNAIADMIGQTSAEYPGKVWVVPGNVEASFLYRKMRGDLTADEGELMPLAGPVSAAELELVRLWIEDGASADCSDAPPPPPPEDIVPGGDISSHISAPSIVSGFTDNVPDGVSGTCSTNQYWQFRDAESSKMHPGRACLQCHRNEDEGPRDGYLGTVQQALDDADDCRGVKDVLVEILDDSDGSVVASGSSNSAGNFIIESSFSQPYRVRMTLDGRTREMLTAQTDTDCMSCHSAEGTDGAPGRIVAP